MRWWYTECLICQNLDQISGKCKQGLFKPKPKKDGVCKYYLLINTKRRG